MKKNVWVVVANESAARLYDLTSLREPLRPVGHLADGRTHPQEAERFARRVTEVLEAGRRAGEFQGLVVMAGPPFLGMLRAAMPNALQAVITAEVHKDLVHQGEPAVRAHLPPDAFPLS